MTSKRLPILATHLVAAGDGGWLAQKTNLYILMSCFGSPLWVGKRKILEFIGQPLFVWIFILAFLLRKLFLAVILAALSAIGEASLKMIQEALLTSRRATAKVLDGAVLVSQVIQMGATAGAASAFREHFGTGFADCLVLGLSYQDSPDWNIGPEEHGEYRLHRASCGNDTLLMPVAC